MSDIIALVIGATGQTGELLVDKLLLDDSFTKIRVLSRKPIDKKHPKLETISINFDDLTDLKKKMGNGDTIFSCIGATMKNVKGDKEVYRSIDWGINVNSARIGLENGFRQFVLMSSVGASPSSSNFYLKLKGETEEAIARFGFESVQIMQPSMLLGNRKAHRTGEQFAKLIFKTISPLLIGNLKKYKAIESATVAEAMIASSKIAAKGVHRYGYAEMMGLLQKK